jgi:hypothetical protein
MKITTQISHFVEQSMDEIVVISTITSNSINKLTLVLNEMRRIIHDHTEKKINSAESFERLFQSKLIRTDHDDMFLLQTKSFICLPSIDFLHNVNHSWDTMKWRATWISYEQSTIRILVTFVEDSLGPLFDRVARSATLIDDSDSIEKWL